MHLRPWLIRISQIALVLSFFVIMLGAYTRLKDAGLGCPDWPGCYGQVAAPSSAVDIAKAELAFPDAPVDSKKALIEMVHRYFASALGLLILSFTLLSYHSRKFLPLPTWLPFLLLGLVIGQGMLGMWTVTLKLLPIIVMAHLLGGFCTLSLIWLCCLYLKSSPSTTLFSSNRLNKICLFALVLLCTQIALGGWTSANYAALSCPDFPLCQGQFLPSLDLINGFNPLNGVGAQNPIAVMSLEARTAVHFIHRLGAVLTSCLLLTLAGSLWLKAQKSPLPNRNKFYRLSISIILLLVLQVSLGITNVLAHLPLPVAVMHNGVAALLLLCLINTQFTLAQANRGQSECIS